MWARYDTNGVQVAIAVTATAVTRFSEQDGYIYHELPHTFNPDLHTSRLVNGSVVVDNTNRDSQEYYDAKLAGARAKQARHINGLRNALFFSDITISGGRVLDGDESAITNLKEAMLSSEMRNTQRVLDPSIPLYQTGWILKDNSVTALSSTDIREIAETLEARKGRLWMAARVHKDKLTPLNTLKAIKEYDYSGDWE